MKGLVLLLYFTARYKVVVYRPFFCNYIIVLEKQLIQPKYEIIRVKVGIVFDIKYKY
jgi:hypothetical protein